MVFYERIKTVSSFMQETGIPQLIVSDDANLLYLTGHAFFALERMGVLLIRDSGEAMIFANDVIELEDEGVPIFIHSDKDNPYTELAKALMPGKVGIDKHWPAGHLMGLLKERNDLVAVNGSLPLELARLIKTSEEVTLLRKASELNDRVMAYAIGRIKEDPSLCEETLSGEIERFFRENGAERNPYFQVVCYGTNTAFAHHSPDRITELRPGNAVLFDLFAPKNGYWCDMTRTVFYKEISSRHRKIYDIVRQAQQAAIDTARPGVPIKKVYDTCVKYIHEAGFSFEGRIGHGIGVDIHEYPDISPTYDIVLRPSMTFTLEPGIYVQGEIGVRIEDTVLITETGCRPINHFSKELKIIG